jgi:endonuclease/exonuclease/phosphatase (EEP) superfamily protein YafD
MTDETTFSSPQPGSNWQRIGRAASSITAAVAIVLVALTLAGFVARMNWRCEQACHFRVQYFWLLGLAGLFLLCVKRRRLAALALIASLVNLVVVAGIYSPARTEPAAAQKLKLVSFNVLGENQRHDDVAAFLRSEQPDLVLLMEVQPAWKECIAQLGDLYPHQIVEARAGHFGIALLSREPLDQASIQTFGSAELPSVVTTIRLADRQLLFVGTHPPPPGTRAMAEARDEQLRALASFVKSQNGPVVLMGDLNTTSYSPVFRNLCESTGLRDSRQGFGIQATWMPRLPILEIAIDHCLVPPEIHVANRRVGPHLGSDHRPVIVELMLSIGAQ